MKTKILKRAFSLIELLVVIAIIGLLISLLIPAVQAAREMARRSSCANHIRQLSLAMLTYHDALKSFPSGNICQQNFYEAAECHTAIYPESEIIYCGSIGWPALLLPYLEQSDLYEKVNFDKRAYLFERSDGSEHNQPFGDEENRFVSRNMPSIFSCISAVVGSEPHTQKDYAVNGLRGAPERRTKLKAVFHGNSNTRISDLERGATHTFMILEEAHHWWWVSNIQEPEKIVEMTTGSNPFLWVNRGSQGYAGTDGNFGPDHKINIRYVINMKNNWKATGATRSYHPKGINVSACDGRVTFISEKMDFDNYKGLFERTGKSLAKLP